MHHIRNFSIIAHIDHGKSTLADRLMELCDAIEDRKKTNQMLDSMDIERERGITIKAQTVKLNYKAQNGEIYYLNLIDTPGHVDFAYEVDRSLAACEGSLLVVDATQGIEAQTLANVYKALDNYNEIIVVLNKIDLPSAEAAKVKMQIADVIGLPTENAIEISAKSGKGVQEVLEAIVKYIPPPGGLEEAPLQALLVDSWYDIYLGVVILVRVKNGVLKKDSKILMMAAGVSYVAEKIGIFTPEKVLTGELKAGEIGFITAGIKKISDCKVGDTITELNRPCESALPGFKPVKPAVYCGLFPADSSEFQALRQSLEKLNLNDSSFTFEAESSISLGYGFRCGFLGMLHLEVIQERLEREFDLALIATAPSVIYRIHLISGEIHELHNPADLPDVMKIDYMEEPWVKVTIMSPDNYVGDILEICQDRRGEKIDLQYVNNRAFIIYNLPLGEMVFDFHDRLKSTSKGYASFDWEFLEYRESTLVKLSILVNSEAVDALSAMLHKSRAESRGREICKKLGELIPRQQYKIAIQAAIGGKIIARETINPYRKDVTAKLYGGDRTRRMKLLEKQKKGKKRMYTVGNVEIPKNVFIEALKVSRE